MDFLLTALSALVGGGAGAWAALERFKRQRAFDRRLEWYEEAVTAFHTAGLEIVGATQAQRRLGPGERTGQQWTKAAKAIDRLRPTLAKAELYAQADSVSRISTLYKKIGKLTVTLARARAEGGGVNEKALKSAEEMASEYAGAAADLSEEAREHLSLDRLVTRISFFSGPSG